MCSLLTAEPIASTASLIILLMGPPGAGKGTHAGPLSEHLKIPHISTGELFRSNIRKNTSLGQQANAYLADGKLVPDALTLDMLFDRLAQTDCQKGCILDGFPRTVPQAEAFVKRMDPTSKLVILHFCIDEAPLIERITGRRVCKQCGTPYHIKFNPPQKPAICDRCTGNLYQRDDDTEAVIRKRLEVYEGQTKPVLLYYARRGDAIREVSGVGDPEQIFKSVLHAIDFAGKDIS